MKLASFALVTLLTACGGSPKSAPVVANTVGTGVTATPAMSDIEFRAAIVDYAKKTNRMVGSWGTVLLDGEHPSRFATLPTLDTDVLGAYIFDLGAAGFVAVVFNSDGRATPFERGDGTPMDPDAIPWTVSPAKQIDHASGHHHGGESLTFGLRDGKLVLFSYNYQDDATDPSSQNIAETFLVNGTCTPACPELRAHEMNDSSLTPSAPAPTIGAIVEPTPQQLD